MDALPAPTPLRIDAATQALSLAGTFAQPADQILHQFFRTRRELGQLDRAFAAEVMFAVLRRWRTLQQRALTTATPDDVLPAAPAASASPRRLVLLALTSIYGLSARALEPVIGRIDAEWLARSHALDQGSLPPALALDIPDWLYQRLHAKHGVEETAQLVGALNQPAPLDLRVNPMKIDRPDALGRLHALGLTARATPYSPLGMRIDGRPTLGREPLYESGSIEVQDEGSQLLALLVAPKRREMVVDFCAGAGGKTLALGALMQSTGRLYAFDVSARRLKAFEPRLKRSGLSNVHPQVLESETDARVKRLAGKIDRVLVDAPCTGLGTLRRNPDMKWRQSENAIAEMVAKQTAILASSARLVKPGGRLVYATCSLLDEENGDLVASFLAANPTFTLIPANEVLRAQGIALDTGPFLELLPHRHGTDGFFAAVLGRSAG
ncbi:MAG: RsmB/NOP family class I SAM-dependent RNA methyltransferase [Proteobacteria bacterium]|nr:RsmB/NOP family class I SAM-dependent RNA methyltransferase [Burkholderiales bacterium]